MSNPYAKLPAWAEYGLIPLVNLVVAFLVAGAGGLRRSEWRRPDGPRHG